VLANLLIGLREGLEAGLVVGILVAYLRKIGRTDVLPKLWIGVGAAIALSLGFGALLTWGPYGLETRAQEAIGGVLSIVAVGLVTWMIFWMAGHARRLKGELHERLDKALRGGTGALVALGVIAVGREGIETALFVWASVKASGDGALGAAGAFVGLAISVVIAYLIYRGAVRINLRQFFLWTGAFLVVVVAGIFAYGLGDLQEAGILPGLGQAAYNVGAIIPPTSWYGILLTGLFQYKADPTWLQVIGWTVYLVVVMALFLRASHVWRRRPAAPAEPAPASRPAPLPNAAR